jgi:hypothetical protein
VYASLLIYTCISMKISMLLIPLFQTERELDQVYSHAHLLFSDVADAPIFN